MASILLIEDEEQIRSMLKLILENAGHEVAMAVNGQEGLQSYAANRVDIVITDLIMPRMEGLETITELRRSYPDVKIIAISGGSRSAEPESYLRMARHFGADHVLAKPFSNKELLNALDSVLGS